MSYLSKIISEKEIKTLFEIEENYFNDFKSKDISASKLSKTLSAFANASGGDIYLGIREENASKIKHWEGFANIEEANQFIQMISEIIPIDSNYDIVFLKHHVMGTYVMQITVLKTESIIRCTDGKTPYIRKNAQNLPCDTSEKVRQLELDKGITSFENELIAETDIEDISQSDVFDLFCRHIVPGIEKELWLKKQKLFRDKKITVAGLLLFSDEPQISLPKRSSIKIFRYQTSEQADRDTLVDAPLTIEGCAYQQIKDAVDKTKCIIESIRKLDNRFENVNYPEETLHEIITNAVLHRDYSITTDIQIRIFDNRVEIESPGNLPGHVTVQNILESQSARNPKVVRLINKFPDAPNKDVGEGLNTAFEAMTKLRLKEPEIIEENKSVLVIIKHEKLASPEDVVMQFLEKNEEITNRIGREITGIKSENTMKRVFLRLRDRDYIQMIPDRKGSAAAWQKKNS